jgi:hypothetical protein
MLTTTHTKQDLLIQLPALPAAIQYYDDFTDEQRYLVTHQETDVWPVTYDGQTVYLNFSSWRDPVQNVLKHWAADMLHRRSPQTTDTYLQYMRTIPPACLLELLRIGPMEIRSFWKKLRASGISLSASQSLKSFLFFLCTAGIGNWNKDWKGLLSQLPSPSTDPYASIRTGQAFLTVEEETALVSVIDSMSASLSKKTDVIQYNELVGICVLICSYQFGMRPKQIAMLRVDQVRIWQETGDDLPAVHLTFTMIKQRSGMRVFAMVRKVKREWAPLFVELLAGARHRKHSAKCWGKPSNAFWDTSAMLQI